MSDIKLGRHRGLFCAVWYDEQGGRRHRRSLGTDDRTLAQTRLAAFKTSLAVDASKPLTIADIWTAYVADRQAEEKSTARMDHAWKRLEPHYGHLRPIDLTKEETRSYIAKRKAKGVKPGTIHTELVYLRAALAFAVKSRWLTQPPEVPVPQKPAPKSHHLTRAEAKRLLDAAVMPHVKLFIRLALATAGRSAAILDLTWDRVNLKTRRIYLHDPARDRTRKGRATVPINDSLHAALTEAQKGAVAEYVVEWGGAKVVSVKKGIAAAAARAGVTCSPHVLRHTAAVWMAEEGVAMSKIAQYLGHDNDRTTQRVYARFSPDFMQDAAAALEL